MSNKRFAQLYSDGSLNVSSEGDDLVRARNLLCDSSDDDDTELVEVEISVIRSYGQPKMKIVKEHSAICDLCHSTVYFNIEEPKQEARHAD